MVSLLADPDTILSTRATDERGKRLEQWAWRIKDRRRMRFLQHSLEQEFEAAIAAASGRPTSSRAILHVEKSFALNFTADDHLRLRRDNFRKAIQELGREVSDLAEQVSRLDFSKGIKTRLKRVFAVVTGSSWSAKKWSSLGDDETVRILLIARCVAGAAHFGLDPEAYWTMVLEEHREFGGALPSCYAVPFAELPANMREQIAAAVATPP